MNLKRPRRSNRGRLCDPTLLGGGSQRLRRSSAQRVGSRPAARPAATRPIEGIAVDPHRAAVGQDSRPVWKELGRIGHPGFQRHVLADTVAVQRLDRLPDDFDHAHPRTRLRHSSAPTAVPVVLNVNSRHGWMACPPAEQETTPNPASSEERSPGLGAMSSGFDGSTMRDGPGQYSF